MTYIKISPDDRKRWAELLKDMPNKAAKEQDAKGSPGSLVFGTYLKYIRESGYSFPFDYQL
jgi:hypothetical protein